MALGTLSLELWLVEEVAGCGEVVMEGVRGREGKGE